MTIGTSAPPTGRTNRTPRPSETSIRATSRPVEGTGTPVMAIATAARKTPEEIQRPAGRTTGRVVISSWSLAKVTIEPAKETEPTRIVKTVAVWSPPLMREDWFATVRNSTRANTAADQPTTSLT